MMVQDSITWTGARAPGVERRMSLAWRCSTEQVASDTERRTHTAAESTKGGGKPDPRNGNAGSKLTAVRNLRGDDGNVGIIRSPVRAIVLPDKPFVAIQRV